MNNIYQSFKNMLKTLFSSKEVVLSGSVGKIICNPSDRKRRPP